MAKEIENLNINGEIFEFSKIYAKMGLTFERFVELIGRDLYCPTMDSEPTSSTLTYVDTDGSVNNFQIGQMCRWSDGDDYRVAICTSATPIETSWYILPKEMSNVQAVDTVDELDDVETNTYLKYTAQNLTEAQKAQARANIGVSAGNSSSGGGSSSGGSGAYAEVNHGTSDTTFTLTPNTFHVWDEVASLDLSFADEQAGVANEYLFQFTSGATATTLTLPDGLKWANNNAPTIAENMIYQVSVLKGLASVLEFNKPVELIVNRGTYNSGVYV